MSLSYVHGSANPGPAGPANQRHRLEIRNLAAAGKPGQRIRNVSLDVRGGEILTIVGPSGSGKSRLLRLVAGLDFPDSGTVTLGGRDLTSLPPRARGFGVVFQDGTLFRRLTVEENVAFGLVARRLNRSEVSRKVDGILNRFGLDEVRHALPGDLSGGQKRKVELARALACRPQAVLLDEPFKALDAVSRLHLRQIVRSLIQSCGAPTLLITHDQEEALELGDQVAVFNEGRVEQIGSPFELYLHPSNVFVATFFGAANVLLGSWNSGSVRVGSLTLEAPPDGGFEDRQSVKVVFRPEDLVVNFSPQLLDCPHFLGEGVVEEVFYIGATERLVVRLQPRRIHAPGERASAKTPRPILVEGKSLSSAVQIIAVRSKREAEEMELSTGDSVVLGLRTFRVIPHYPLAAEGGPHRVGPAF